MSAKAMSCEIDGLAKHQNKLARLKVGYPNIKPTDYSWWRPCDAPYIIGDMIREYDDSGDIEEFGIMTVAQDWVVINWNDTASRWWMILGLYVAVALCTFLILPKYWHKNRNALLHADDIIFIACFSAGWVIVLIVKGGGCLLDNYPKVFNVLYGKGGES